MLIPIQSKNIKASRTQVFDEAIVEVSSGQLVRLPELGSRLNVGDSGSVSSSTPDSFCILNSNVLPQSILPPVPSTVQNLFGLLQGTIDGSKDTVIAVKHNAYAVAWLALNQSVRLSPHPLTFDTNFSTHVRLYSLNEMSQQRNRDHNRFGRVKNSGCSL